MSSEEKDTEVTASEEMETDQTDQVTNKEEEKEPEKPESNEQTSDLKKEEEVTDEPMEESTTEVKESDETPTKDEPEMKAEEMNEVQEEMETETENKVNEGTEPENTETDNEEESDLKTLYPENYQSTASGSRRLRINFRPVSDESDAEYKSDDNEVKKTIMVGSDYQAQIPEEFSKYDDALPYENKDKLVWDGCDKLSEDEILDYLRKVRSIAQSSTANLDPVTQQLLAIPTGKHLRDDEQALFLLQQCGHDIEEALRRRKIAAAPPEEAMSAWSEEECRNFETGLRLYGKNFHQIQLSKVKTRSVGEIVQFYYLWKKSERHDVFASKARLDKKKYSLNPGQCIMDRFLEDQDGTSNVNNDTNDVQQTLPRNMQMPMCV